MRSAREMIVVVGLAMAGVGGGAQADPVLPGGPDAWLTAVGAQVARIEIGSGPVVGTSGAAEQASWAQEVSVPGAAWLALDFGGSTLQPGDSLVVTSMLDGCTHRLDADSLREWSMRSAYMNGDSVLVELVLGASLGERAVHVARALAGGLGSGAPESLCGPTDDRLARNEPTHGRILPALGTAFLTTKGGRANQFVCDGHSFPPGTVGLVVQMNVPASTGAGAAVNPPPEFQFAVDPASIQVTNTGPGQDVGVIQTFANSNSGLHARIAQGTEAIVLANAAPAPSGQTLRINGYGTVAAPLSPTWNFIQKTGTGPYNARAGTTLSYQVDTTAGDPGAPIILESSGLAIGVHSSGGCTAVGGNNLGTAVENAVFQGFLNVPKGVVAPFSATEHKCLPTTFASNNGGSKGGSIFFDVQVGKHPLKVNALCLNINNNGALAELDDNFTFDVYLTPGTAAGKQTNPAEWMLISSGAGMPNPENTRTIGGLFDPFVLEAETSYGVAVILDAAAGHAYTNGTGSNEVYSNTNLTLTGISASNTPFGAVLTPRVFNGCLCYEVQPTKGDCLPTLFAQNNGGGNGGMVYFDVVVGPKPVTITGFTTNVEGAGGLDCTAKIYTTPGGRAGKQTNPGAWNLRANAAGTSEPVDTPTALALDNFFTLSAGATFGVAIELTTSGVGSEGHAYTNGTGTNQDYTNTTLEILTGDASNAPFTATIFTPRVWNGSLCYAVDYPSSCKTAAFDQTPPNPLEPSWNSNIAGGIASTQQVADNFTPSQDFNVTGVELYAVYTGDNSIPLAQSFEVRFYNNAGGLPGAVVANRVVTNVEPIGLGMLQTGFATPRALFRFDLSFGSPVTVNAGTTLWLSPVGDTDGKTWSWQRIDADPAANAIRSSPVAAWNANAGNLAFRLCGTPFCYADCDESGALNIFDYICFGNAYSAQQAYADCDGNGAWNIFDYICYGNAYAAGCP